MDRFFLLRRKAHGPATAAVVVGGRLEPLEWQRCLFALFECPLNWGEENDECHALAHAMLARTFGRCPLASAFAPRFARDVLAPLDSDTARISLDWVKAWLEQAMSAEAIAAYEEVAREDGIPVATPAS